MPNSRCQPRWRNQEEPCLGELLADPVCRLLMQRDGITAQAMAALVDRVRETVGL